jgi:2-polyprenyl-3-methyl-5-hydroxy-6-metoxy-1,4-benzoquinol methylase
VRRRLEHAPELLDEAVHDAAELEQSLDHVAEVNRWLGGSRAVWHALQPLLAHAPTTRILDLGTGSADIPVDLCRRAARARVPLNVTATDIHPQMLDIALRRTARLPQVRVQHADALALPFADDSFDIALLSLTLHHFEGDELPRVLREAARVASRAIVVNELERCRANWWGARLLAATRWRGNRLTRHDGPRSVLRAFTMPELRELAAAADLRVQRLERRFFYRLVMVAEARRD